MTARLSCETPETTMHVLLVQEATLSAIVRASVISKPMVNDAADVGSERPWPGGIATAEIPRRYCSLSENSSNRPFSRFRMRILTVPMEVSDVNSEMSSFVIKPQTR